ncbi:Alpha-catulin [Araneus ventricosus]|uniref:Alpha-catulin n=1 Tax=Araneus ventricosus TaxID=182803 RepID=A0A4Y2GYF7_ARAVE|nr:Alpha-catulin [Araneus ventricosus]
MLTGYAYTRAVIAHTLLHLTLATIISKELVIDDDMDANLQNTIEDVKNNTISYKDIENCDEKTEALLDQCNKKLKQYEGRGSTGKLWVQYFHMVLIAKEFIRAERLGDWQAHLNCVKEMIQYFHASWHFPYAKSTYLYLQDMLLSENLIDPSVFSGFLTVRCSAKFSCGTSTDMIIEQSLMKSVQTDGGISRERSTQESVISKQVYRMHAANTVCERLEDLDIILTNGTRFLLAMYGAPNKIDSIDKYRYLSFVKNTRNNKRIQLSCLPPTSTAAYQHLCRVYYQVQVCLGNELDPENWGWEQAKIAKLGLEMKLLTSEIDAETERWSSTENDLCKRARSMSQMAFSMYQFTRGEGDLKTTQDLFTQAEFFAEEANKLYKLVRQFSYLVPGGQHKNELLEYLDKVPTFVQQLQFTVKNPTVGKAATFTKVDNVIQETKNLMNVISKVVTTCLFCATKYNIDFHSLTSQTQTASPYQNDLEDYAFDRSTSSSNLPSKDLGQNSSKPNI